MIVNNMPVLRVKKTKDYTVMSNYHLRDKNISLKAKGLLSYMLSLPDYWEYSISGLAAICKEGPDCIRATVQELESNGYITRTRERSKNGQLGGIEYVVREFPLQKNPMLENPMLGTSTEEEPRQINTNAINTNHIKNELKPPISPYRGESFAAFDRFWQAYPRKVGKQAALKAFKKVKVSVEILVEAVEKQKRSSRWKKDNGQYIPNPATWLNQGRWDDEVDTASGTYSERHSAPLAARDGLADMEKYLQQLRAENERQPSEEPDGEMFG